MANQVQVLFQANHDGQLQTENSETNISFKGNGFAPYEMFLGGYASCLHATFLGIATKKRLTFDTVHYDVYATKREEVPTLLNYVKTTITFTGVTEKKQQAIIKSLELAERYCSISAMINNIATMEFDYIFK
ncbi:OsmC family protein [Candidatus Xianfuyuplasma coldseepsis]|uniref:OsmC family protein n=1 Tax=Candidatus Xianfuyuplasma coldseepsis TaxID=2782163 RepID=A0A7L7KUZ9_9MOLU|nr:OsmC family protein [Xianfuyuplasma coldseepsis]QMS85598.1 OsmC family protein [Xianfuyuplasma coldseepsis]